MAFATVPYTLWTGSPRAETAMFLEQRQLLDAAEVAQLTAMAQQIPFVDGRASNPHNTTKQNLQAEFGHEIHRQAGQLILAAFNRSRPFLDFAMPKKIAPPMLARYENGMRYGPHADSAFLTVPAGDGTSMSLRSDLSCTIFLNDPKRYAGGELMLRQGSRAMTIKGNPGDAFVYPSTLLHEVMAVNQGQRLVAITFIESQVPDEVDRYALYELKDVLALEGLKMDWTSRVRMETVLQNLTRRWARQ